MSGNAAPEPLRRYWILAAAIVVIDQASKAWVEATLRDAPRLELIPGWLNFVYTRNPGGLFGYFTELAQPWRTMLLTVLPVFAIALVVYYLVRGDDLDRFARLALSLVLGGAVGNLIDRLFRGAVVDFIDAHASGALGTWLIEKTGTAHWHTFNVADSCIVCGAILLLISAFWPQPKGGRGVSPTEHVES
jgi:signal peptidase II